jgi:DinB superfamily
MSTSTSLKTHVGNVGEIENFRHSARTIHKVVRLNTEGLTQAESLIQPRAAGNCLNWVVGHLLCVYQKVLPMLEQRPVIKASALQRYDRGSSPISNADGAMELSELMDAWEETAERIDAGLAGLASETLDRPAPFSPSGDPNETVRSLFATLFFHQAYHAGQTGILRRIAGKEGAIR